MTVFIVILLVAAGLAFVRLAPSDPAKWHVPVRATEDRDLPGGAIRVKNNPDVGLAELNAIALEWPRTTRLAGTVEEGRITYVTRTKWIGYPDYTTVEIKDDQLLMFARLRFGLQDFGVNRARLEAWLGAL